MTDIIERLMDFDHCGNTATDRVEMRESAAAEIFKLRHEMQRATGAMPNCRLDQHTIETCARIAESLHGVEEGDAPQYVFAGKRIARELRSLLATVEKDMEK